MALCYHHHPLHLPPYPRVKEELPASSAATAGEPPAVSFRFITLTRSHPAVPPPTHPANFPTSQQVEKLESRKVGKLAHTTTRRGAPPAVSWPRPPHPVSAPLAAPLPSPPASPPHPPPQCALKLLFLPHRCARPCSRGVHHPPARLTRRVDQTKGVTPSYTVENAQRSPSLNRERGAPFPLVVQCDRQRQMPGADRSCRPGKPVPRPAP